MSKRSKPTTTVTAAEILGPEAFAPFTETELADLAARLSTAPETERADAVRRHPVGAELLKSAGDPDAVVRPVLEIWGRSS